MRWGDRWAVEGEPPTLLVHDACGAELEQLLRCPRVRRRGHPTHIRSRHDHGSSRSDPHATMARASPTARRCSSRSRCCAATGAATAPSPRPRPGSSRRTSPPTRCSPSPRPAPVPAATRPSSRSARRPRSATRSPARWLDEHGLRLDRRLPRRHGPPRARRDRPAPPRQRRRARRRRPRPAAHRRPEPGDDARVAPRRPRRPPGRARQDPRAAPRHPRGRRRAADPLHHRHPRRHRRGPRRPHRGPRGHRRQPPPPRPRAGGHRPELPAEARDGDARRAAVPARRLPRRHRPGPRRSCRPTSTCRRRRTSRSPTSSADLLAAGIDDWGGVSPVTADHVNPERPWPALDRAPGRHRGRRLRAGAPPHHLPRARRRSRALARRGHPLRRARPLRRRGARPRRPRCGAPGAHQGGHRRRHRRRGGADRARATRPGTAAHRSCPPTLVARPARPRPSGPGRARCSTASPPASSRARTSSSPCSRPAGREVGAVAEAADDLRRRLVGDDVTWVRNRNINYTNVCTFKCRFCGFSKGPLSLNLRGNAVPAHPRGHRRAGASRPPTSAPPRCASRAASTPTSTATTTSTSPGPCTRRRRTSTSTASPPSRSPRAPSGSASRSPTTSAASWTPGSAHAARHRRRDPRRRGPRRALPRQDQHRGVARGPPHRPLGRAAQQRHDHVRRRSSHARLVGPTPRRHPRPPGGDGRLHRVRRPAVRAHGVADLPAAQGPAGARPSARRCSCTRSPASPTAS